MQFRRFIFLITLFGLRVGNGINKTRNGQMYFDEYPRYQDIQDYLARLKITHQNIVDVQHFGQSVESRHITYIKISSGGNNTKPLIIIDAGIHAREWLSVLQALYIIYELVENRKSELTFKVDWLIVPLVNPDGYEYSHRVDKLWRKNRSRGKFCVGVDLNRNFDFHWLQFGASDLECSKNFAGAYPFSEPESLALRELLIQNSHRIKMYITLHSYAQSILYPWGFTTDLPDNHRELHQLATQISHTVYELNSTEYKVGSAANLLYLGSGSSRDWVYGVLNIPFAYTIELKGPRFQVPTQRILDVISEMFEGIKAAWSFVEHKYGYRTRFYE